MGRACEGVFGLNRSVRRWLWTPVAVAILLQALLLFTARPEIAFDSASYIAQAKALAATGQSLNARGEPDTVRTPGYPLFLAAFLETPLGLDGAVAVQRLLWVLMVAGVTWAAFHVTRSTTAAVTAGLVTSVDLPAVQAAGAVLTETLAAVVVTVAVLQAYRATMTRSVTVAAIAGLCAGAAALVRPVAILLGVAIAVAIALTAPREWRTRLAIAVALASLVIPAAWTARNYARTGVVTFSSISSINLLLYRAAGTLAIRDPGGMDANIQRRQAELEAAACRVAEARFGGECDAIPITRRATVYSGLAMPIILGDPVAAAQQAGRAFVMIMFGGGANLLSSWTGMSESTARLLAFAYTVPLFVLAAAGAFYWWRIDRVAAALMLCTIAYMVLMSLGVEAYSRFRVPILPLYAMLAGGGVKRLTAAQ
jgi:4-amino-4-deoxy-L-arabinose transferase-like glycosyltransferase